MAGCLEDLSTTNSGDSGESERLLSDNEWEKIQTVHQQSGYREGVSLSRDSHVQEGFRDGFQSALQHSVNIGYLKGLISPCQNNSLPHTEVDQFCGQLQEFSKAKQCPERNQHVNFDGMRTVEDFIDMHNNDQTTNLYKQCTILRESVSKTIQST